MDNTWHGEEHPQGALAADALAVHHCLDDRNVGREGPEPGTVLSLWGRVDRYAHQTSKRRDPSSRPRAYLLQHCREAEAERDEAVAAFKRAEGVVRACDGERKHAESEVKKLRELLADVQWRASVYRVGHGMQFQTGCISCRMPQAEGHTAGCRVGSALSLDEGIHTRKRRTKDTTDGE